MTVPSETTPDTTAATDTPAATDMARGTSRRANEFMAGLPQVADPTGREMIFARVGMVLMVIGLIVAIIAVILSQSSNNALDQNTQMTIAVAGIAATVFGGVIFLRYSLGRLLRYWLLRMLHEMHDQRG